MKPPARAAYLSALSSRSLSAGPATDRRPAEQAEYNAGQLERNLGVARAKFTRWPTRPRR